MISERIYKALIPDDIASDIVKYSYAKNLVSACVISIIASPIYAFLYYLLHDHAAAYAILFVEVLILCSLAVLKYFRSLFYCNIIFIASFTCLIFWITYTLGGIHAETAYWLILPPIIAAFIGGMRAAYFWCVISLMLTSYMYFLEYNGVHLPISPIKNAMLLQYISICGLAIIIVLLIHFYEIGKKSSLERLRFIAYHDELTGLPNRIAYEEILMRAVEKAKRHHSQFAVFYIDIDQFSKINTIFGRNVGDWLLRELVLRIKRYIRHTDIMARVGGDEFKIVIEITHSNEAISELADIILMAIKLPYHIKKDEINITASIGIAVYSKDGAMENLIDRYADIALSKAKSIGGNTLQYFTESLAQEEALQAEVEYHLSDAIRNNELSLYFQPQFDIKQPTRITGVEALLRWNNKKLGEVPPGIFIPIAEKMGIISQFGEWILKEACQQYVMWMRAGLINVPLAINVSVHQLYNEHFLSFVEDLIKQTRIPPDRLELELTETAIITDLPRAINMMHSLNNLGVRFVIDDFGAGYTSLSYLDRLPISVLKMDKSFLDDLLSSVHRSTIIASIIELAHKINLVVIGEGVENLEQLNYLEQINCDYAQGYYLCMPLDVVSMQNLLAAIKKKNT